MRPFRKAKFIPKTARQNTLSLLLQTLVENEVSDEQLPALFFRANVAAMVLTKGNRIGQIPALHATWHTTMRLLSRLPNKMLRFSLIHEAV